MPSVREAVISYPLTYTFEIQGNCRFGPNCESIEPRAPEVTQSQHKITITVEPECTCDPSVTITRIKFAPRSVSICGSAASAMQQINEQPANWQPATATDPPVPHHLK
jgi:hypothetical protein